MNKFSDIVVHYGYAGLFTTMLIGILALPLPVETILVLAGVLAGRGKFSIVLVALSALAGCLSGISLSYLVGLTAGAKLLTRYGRYVRLTPEYVERAHNWFQTTGEWILLFAYFVTGIRHLAGLFAGMSRLEYRTFALFAYLGGTLWVTVFLSLGYILGDRWESAMAFVHHYTYIALLAAAIGLGVAYLVKRRFRKSKRQTV